MESRQGLRECASEEDTKHKGVGEGLIEGVGSWEGLRSSKRRDKEEWNKGVTSGSSQRSGRSIQWKWAINPSRNNEWPVPGRWDEWAQLFPGGDALPGK
jgi:hypothetical protein